MEPAYLIENRYSYLLSSYRRPATANYQASSPETEFEQFAHGLFLEGQEHLHHEEYRLALASFRELQALILKTVNPKMPTDPNSWTGTIGDLVAKAEVLDPLIAKAGDILDKTPPPRHTLPDTVLGAEATIPPRLATKLAAAVGGDVEVTSHHGGVADRVRDGVAAAARGDWRTAATRYEAALADVPADDKAVRGALLHDLAVIQEKNNRRSDAIASAEQGTELLGEVKDFGTQATALGTLAGILHRGGDEDRASEAVTAAERLVRRHNLHHVTIPAAGHRPTAVTTVRPGVLAGTSPVIDLTAVEPAAAPQLLAADVLETAVSVKALKIHGDDDVFTVELGKKAGTSVKKLLQQIEATVDLGLLLGFAITPVQMIAYLPHLYFFVLPMCIGDCLAGLGDLDEAEHQYRSVLPYPFINRNVETVKLWTRLADVYLRRGDEAYRAARDDTTRFAAAKTAYERIVRTTGTLDGNSPLYKDAKLAKIRQRVETFVAADDPTAVDDNPAILTRVTQARIKLAQIKAGLNFFGFAADYTPPFSFEYLQNTARYFAQHASHIEQRYIQFKSTAENEEFRREQLDQQADVARMTRVLEERGVAEAEAGIAVAQASLNYAETQRQNAVAARNDFDAVRWELLELSEAEAWANASSVDRDDQVKLTWNGHYYSSNKKRRNRVIQDLAYQRTRISHDLEANKLDRAIAEAQAYKGIAQAQVQQAAARRDIARMRVRLAALQQRQAEENRDYLDMKEFSAHLWFELAREARTLARRYVDTAIEIAMLMERAYNAETERGLEVIGYSYEGLGPAGLMAADRLLADIDHFTLDFITTTRSKKAPVKRTISLADAYPMAFHRLKTTGVATFATAFEDFDREHPGLYLCKVRNVELLFVGVSQASSVAGTLRNVGVSKFRRADGSEVARLYPADVLPLSHYDLRQDALAFRFDPKDLKLFENQGIETLWQLDLPRDANELDPDDLLDIQLVLYYDGFYDPGLEANVRAALPTSGSASRALSLRAYMPDELFYLRNRGEAEIDFGAHMFPRNQTDLQRTGLTLKAAGASAANLTLRLQSVASGADLTVTTDASGEVAGSANGDPLGALRGEPALDTWTVTVDPADNPHLVHDGVLDLEGLHDLTVFFEYDFDYVS